MCSEFSRNIQLKKINTKTTSVALVTYHGLAGAFLQIPQQDVVVGQRDDLRPIACGLPGDAERGERPTLTQAAGDPHEAPPPLSPRPAGWCTSEQMTTLPGAVSAPGRGLGTSFPQMLDVRGGGLWAVIRGRRGQEGGA